MGFEFANSAPTQAGKDACVAWLSGPRGEESRWLLVDAALLEREAAIRMRSRYADHVVNAYAGTPTAGFSDRAPHLIECAGGVEADLISELTHLAGDAPALSAIRLSGGISIKRLQQLCNYLARIQVGDRIEKIHCRFADTRVLPTLLAVLSDALRSSLAGSILEWGWFNRLGEWVTYEIAYADPVAEVPAALRLEIEQFRRIQTAAEADGIFHLLLEQTPEVVPDDARGEFHHALSQMLSRASSFKLAGARDRVQFVVLSLTCGDAFHQHPRLASMWADIAANRTSLMEDMRTWDDRLWADLNAAAAQ